MKLQTGVPQIINMPVPISNLTHLLRNLQPVLQHGAYAFCHLPDSQAIPQTVIAWFREAEGVTIILPVTEALASGLQIEFEAAWITLMVHSELSAVGLTAAVAAALSDEGISCNVMAAMHHDHLFVPLAQAEDGMRVLKQLQSAWNVD